MGSFPSSRPRRVHMKDLFCTIPPFDGRLSHGCVGDLSEFTMPGKALLASIMVIARRVVAYSMYTKPKFDHIRTSAMCNASESPDFVHRKFWSITRRPSHHNQQLSQRDSCNSSHLYTINCRGVAVRL
jgi:hypothetical protein